MLPGFCFFGGFPLTGMRSPGLLCCGEAPDRGSGNAASGIFPRISVRFRLWNFRLSLPKETMDSLTPQSPLKWSSEAGKPSDFTGNHERAADGKIRLREKIRT